MASIRKDLADFLDASPPTLTRLWYAQAEQRWLVARAADLRLPPDTPPEIILACAKDGKGNSVASEDYRMAGMALVDELSNAL